MTTFTILSQTDCAKRIKRLSRVATRIQDEIHILAVSTLAHIRDHGDYTLAVSLLDSLPNGQRVKALAHWYGHFSTGAAVFTQNKGAGWACKLAKARTPEMFDIEAAFSTSFADLVAEKGYNTLGIKEALSYLKRKATENGVNPDGSPKVAEEAREMFASLVLAAEEFVADAKRAAAKRAAAEATV